MVFWHRYPVSFLILSSWFYLGGCDHSFDPDIDESISEEVALERIQRVKEFYQIALEKEQTTPLKLRNGYSKSWNSSNGYVDLSDSMVVISLEEMVKQYPPDWENAETWDTGRGYFFATLLGPNVTELNPSATKVPVVRTLVADVDTEGNVIPGSMHIIEFAGLDLDASLYKDYVDQWLVGDLGKTPILVAEYTIGYVFTNGFFYQPDQSPIKVTMALLRVQTSEKRHTFDLICYTRVEYEESCLVADDPPMGITCEIIGYPRTTCVQVSPRGGGGGDGDDSGCSRGDRPCGGGGGSGDSGDKDDEEDELEITVSCPKSVVRGDLVKCQIILAGDSEDVKNLVFKWSSNWGSSHTGRSWEGIATDDATLSVSTDNWTHKETITVKSRNWRAPSLLNANIKYANLDSGIGGKYEFQTTSPGGGPGTGPWKGRYYVTIPPAFKGELYISKNYDTRAIGRLTLPRYPFSYGNLSDEAQSACPKAESFRSSHVSYWYFNNQCGTKSIWEDVSDQIMDHEKEHQAGYNNCLQSTKTSKLFTDLEKLTGTKSVIKSELTTSFGMWQEYRAKLLKAGSYAGITRSIAPFFHYDGGWVYATRIGGRHPYAPTTC